MTNKFAIVVDSVSDIPEELKKKFNIPIVHAKVIIGEKEYLDRVGITREEFLSQLINSKEKITSTQPSPMDFDIVFKKALEKYDHVLSLSVSSKLSASYQNAVITAKRIGKDKITCIDTLSVTHGITLMANHAALRREQGMELSELLEEIKQMIDSQKFFFLVNELKYLQRGGRIGKAKSLIGTLLNKKPLLTLEEGAIDALKSVKGSEAGYEEMVKLVSEYADKYKNFVLAGAYGLDNPDFEKLAQSVKTNIKPLNYVYAPIGPGVLCHVGPNVEAFIITKIPESSKELYQNI
ncbi:MAG: DegV family protein [Candidatus Heimdallarchaeaceae archaeon]